MSDTARAALEQLEAERARRLAVRVERGEAVVLPLLCAVAQVDEPAEQAIAAARARMIAQLRAEGEKREIHFAEEGVIVTGVPRGARPIGGDQKPSEKSSKKSFCSNFTEAREQEERLAYKPPPMPVQSAPEPPTDLPRQVIRCTVRLPDPEKDDPGQIVEASYTVTGNLLRVYDKQDRVLGSEAVRPGDDVEAVARRVLREEHGKHGTFYDPISYRGQVL
jgi:hypothetical protein